MYMFSIIEILKNNENGKKNFKKLVNKIKE